MNANAGSASAGARIALSIFSTSFPMEVRAFLLLGGPKASLVTRLFCIVGELPPGSSNSSHRKELDADSLEGRAKAFELKRYVSASVCSC
jgi:hypothetical protein